MPKKRDNARGKRTERRRGEVFATLDQRIDHALKYVEVKRADKGKKLDNFDRYKTWK